jgi:hypothetical protein
VTVAGSAADEPRWAMARWSRSMVTSFDRRRPGDERKAGMTEIEIAFGPYGEYLRPCC